VASRRARVEDCCFICGRAGADFDWFVLLQGRAARLHCSSSCVAESVDRQQRVATARFRRRLLVGLAIALGAVAVNTVRHYRLPAPEWISGGPAESIKEPPIPGPMPYGPAWPPTDAEWTALFENTRWVYPLPGPTRHRITPDGRVFGPPLTAANHPSVCRTADRCGVDLGGDLWGEHVYAAHDGFVDRIQAGGHDDHGGQYVRLSHFGGMVFTQYFHLAAIPRNIVRGARVKAGELIGLLGDTGTEGGRKHLYFALSVRPSLAFPEVYWDPSPWMSDWPLRVPSNGTVAGFILAPREGDVSRRRRLE
jgi:murein DD-endopeptidase MepM/ murein hydrolase activator NlpD